MNAALPAMIFNVAPGKTREEYAYLSDVELWREFARQQDRQDAAGLAEDTEEHQAATREAMLLHDMLVERGIIYATIRVAS